MRVEARYTVIWFMNIDCDENKFWNHARNAITGGKSIYPAARWRPASIWSNSSPLKPALVSAIRCIARFMTANMTIVI
jgi:hypothetical protein